MPDLPNNINLDSSIIVSRNRPLAFVVGVAGFLGSHLADSLLQHSIQVIGVDDFSTGKKEYLSDALKDKDFHLINRSITEPFNLKIPRIDYAFFVADSENSELFSKGVENFLSLIEDYQQRLDISSSVLKKEEHQLH